MKDFVSNRMLGGVALGAALASAWAVFVAYGLAWPALASFGLLVCLSIPAAYWRSSQSRLGVADLLDVALGEPALAGAPQARVRTS